MPSKRIRSIYPAVSGGGGGAVTLDTPTARWSEDTSADDALARLHLLLGEDAQLDDSLAYILAKEGEDAQADDAWRQTIISANGEDTNVNDLVKVTIIDADVPRTGTPDSDMMFDTYTNQLAAFAGTNFGNGSLQCRGVTTVTPGSDEQRAYIAIDMTALTNFTTSNGTVIAGTNAFRLKLQVANSNALSSTNLTWTLYQSAAKPFTESTATWSSPPTLGTLVGSNTLSIAAGGGFAAYEIIFGATTIVSCLGKWALFVFTGPSAATTLLVDTFTIKSRDDATTGNRPKFTLDYIQRGT